MKHTMDKLKSNPWTLAIALAAVVVIWMASGIGNDPSNKLGAQDISAARELPTVRVKLQQARPVQRRIRIYGRIEPARTVTLAAETTGRIVDVAAKRGSLVSKGDLILQIDMRDRQARLKQAKAEIEKARIRNAAEQRLKSEAFASDTRLAEAFAELESARAEHERIEIDIASTFIRAPFDGALQARFVEIGDYVAPGDPVGEFVEIKTLIVTGTIAENERAWVNVGDHAEAKLVTGELVSGTIRFISPVAHEATRTFAIELEIDNEKGLLPVGITAEINLQAGEVLAHHVSPAILTLDDDGDVGVKTVENGVVRFHEVEIVQSDGDGIWITGLAPSASIITVGQGFVKPGERVDARDADSTLVAGEGAQQ